jgi:hypothetical protein
MLTKQGFPLFRLAPAIISTIISGLQTYFDRALGSILLYRFERAQYADMRKQFITGQHVKTAEGRTMSSIYGAEHLARLLGPSFIEWSMSSFVRQFHSPFIFRSQIT